MKRLMFVYPGLTSYIMPVLDGLAKNVKLDVFYSILDPSLGFGGIEAVGHPNISWHPVKEFRLLGSNRFGFFQVGLIRYLIKERPDAIYIWSNPRYLSYWSLLITAFLFKIPIYPRGHGLFKKVKVSLFHRWMYKIIIGLSTKYICYTPTVKESLERISIPSQKLVVDYNTLYVSHPIRPEEKTGSENDILFIGRLRPLCDIDILIEAVKSVRKKYTINLHIVGGGPLANYVENEAAQHSWIKYYGMLFSSEKISEISRLCRFGCHPGSAGLSVVHLMALSLPVVTHGDLSAQMGPEPEYITPEKNGLFYGHVRDVKELATSIEKLLAQPDYKIRCMQKNAYDTYLALSTPLYHQRLLNIIFGENN